MSDTFSLREASALKQEMLASLHCALPGIVESFSAEAGTAVIRPALRMSSRPERSGAEGTPPSGSILLPLLYDVPVYLPEEREIQPGAFCLLIFADCDLDAWLESGEAEEPVSGRHHSLSDAFAFVGFKAGGRDRSW